MLSLFPVPSHVATPPSLQFRNVQGPTLGSSRAPLRKHLLKAAAHKSWYYRTKWLPAGRSRVTKAFRTKCQNVRAPFTLPESLPLASDNDQMRLARWESELRGIEEHVMLSVFGCLRSNAMHQYIF